MVFRRQQVPFCLLWVEIWSVLECSGVEKLRESKGCRGLLRAAALSFSPSPSTERESSILACRTDPGGWIAVRFLWLLCRRGVSVDFVPSFPASSLQWSWFPPFPGVFVHRCFLSTDCLGHYPRRQ